MAQLVKPLMWGVGTCIQNPSDCHFPWYIWDPTDEVEQEGFSRQSVYPNWQASASVRHPVWKKKNRWEDWVLYIRWTSVLQTYFHIHTLHACRQRNFMKAECHTGAVWYMQLTPVSRQEESCITGSFKPNLWWGLQRAIQWSWEVASGLKSHVNCLHRNQLTASWGKNFPRSGHNNEPKHEEISFMS